MGNPSGGNRWHLRRWLGGLLIAAGALVAAAVAVVPFSSWLGSFEAQAAMAASPAPIDGPRAFGYLEKICQIGPRLAGTEANTKQRQMVAAHFKATGGEVREQPFTATHPLTGQPVAMVNLI